MNDMNCCPHCGYGFDDFDLDEIVNLEMIHPSVHADFVTDEGLPPLYHRDCAEPLVKDILYQRSQVLVYILAKDREPLDSYLGFGARIIDRINGRAIIGIPLRPEADDPETDVKWNRDRLASGLMLAAREIYPSFTEAGNRANLGY